MIRYYKLFDLLNRRGMKKTDLLEVISAPTLAKLSKGANIQTDNIDKICLFLGCQPADIMEVIEYEEVDHFPNFYPDTASLRMYKPMDISDEELEQYQISRDDIPPYQTRTISIDEINEFPNRKVNVYDIKKPTQE